MLNEILHFLLFLQLVEPCSGFPVHLNNTEGTVTLSKENVSFNAPIPLPGSCAWNIVVEQNKVLGKCGFNSGLGLSGHASPTLDLYKLVKKN